MRRVRSAAALVAAGALAAGALTAAGAPALAVTKGPDDSRAGAPTVAAPGAAESTPETTAVTAAAAGKVDCAKVKCVALTFDDGPGKHTKRLLDDLRKAKVPATFFMLGQNVGGNRALVKRMAAEGHELANHTWSHPQLTQLSNAAVRSQISRTNKAIKAAGGVTPRLMRPPYGATNSRVGRAVGMPQIMWSVDTLDWKYRDVARNVRVGVNTPRKGDIVLFHDIHATTVAAIPKVIAGLKKRGFTLVTVSQLYAGKKLKPGGLYYKR
ncbi:polysaccharide deacetylase family protein [Actinomadura kijaniata]|uniref:polysaccharide deacetylase family protein n=1 Tax=Actinomadura kijaniata TaxID=46161 RepID=UPI003F1D63AB